MLKHVVDYGYASPLHVFFPLKPVGKPRPSADAKEFIGHHSAD